MKKNSWRLPLYLGVSAAAILAAIAWARVQYSEQTFITMPVERGTISTVVRATGTVDAVVTVDISSQLSGRVAQVFVNFNDTVRAGQALARIDPEIYAARVKEARAALNVAKAAAQLQQAALERTKLAVQNARTAATVADAELAAARVKQEEAERDFQRNLKLSATSSISDREFTQSHSQSTAGAANLRATAAQAKMKNEAIAIADSDVAMATANLGSAEAVVEQKQASLAQAELDLERTEIRSPIDGVVIKRDVNPGQTVAVTLDAKTLFKIAQDLHEMEVRGRIDEADVGRVAAGQTVSFTVDAYPHRVFSGRVLQIRKSPEVTQNVVTYAAIVSAPNPDLLLLPGMTAVLRILVETTGTTLKIPNEALRFRPTGEVATNLGSNDAKGDAAHSGTAWIMDGQSAKPISVALGASDHNSTQILNDSLREGQQVIVGTATPASRGLLFGFRFGF